MKKAIVLGGSVPHIALINNLKTRGYYTILVDYHDNPPAKDDADEHIQESTIDQEKILEIAKTKKVDLIISTCIDHAIVTACYVAEKLHLPIPFPYQTALDVTNKLLMKQKMYDNGIPTSKYLLVDRPQRVAQMDLTFPVFIKPVDNEGSLGISKAYNIGDVNRYLLHALEMSRAKKAIIEESYQGIETQFDFYVEGKNVTLLMAREKYKAFDNNGKVVSLGSVIPTEMPKEALDKIHEIAAKIAEVFKLNRTALLIQAFVDRDNTINVIEFAARVGGQISYQIIKDITGFDIIDATVNSFLGLNTLNKPLPPDYLYLTYIIHVRGGTFNFISGFDRLLGDGIIEKGFVYKNQGAVIPEELSARSRVGALILKARSRKELLDKMSIVMESLEVYDMQQRPMLRKELRLNF